MRILYLANIRFPTEMAHGVQIAKACEAFAAVGHEVELVVPKRWTPITEPWQEYYGIKTPFTVTMLDVPDTVRSWGRLGFMVQVLSFALAAARVARRRHADVIYGRDEHVLAGALLLGARSVVWESHDGAWNRAARYVARRARKMVVVTEGQKRMYEQKGVDPSKIIAVPNGVDVESFAHTESKEAARARLSIPPDTFVALYVGAFGGWKGTDTLFEAAALLPEHIQVVAIGGYPKQVTAMKEKHPRVLFLGERPYRELADNLAAADVCVLPNTGKDPVSVNFTSPLKLLAYMAAGKPVVASDLPSVRELTGDSAALLVPPDDSQALAAAIEQLAGDAALSSHLAANARKRARQFDWSARAARILSHVSTRVTVLSIYRGRLTENRGTPIRVRGILERLAQDDRFALTIASWDDTLPFAADHLHLTNNKLSDVRALFRVVRERDVRIVLGHTMSAWYYLLVLKLFTRAKIVLEMHGFLEVEARFYGSIGPVRYWIERAVYSLFYRTCDLITTCSDNAAEILKAYNKNTIAVYGGVDTDMFRPDVTPGQFFSRTPGDIVIGYAGNMRKWQGVPFLVEAFEKLRAEDPRYRLVILSSEEKGVPSGDGIEVIRGIPHETVPSFLAACDILVMPRLDDAVSRISIPSKLFEYLAMGKPVVASATSDAHRVITDGVDGFIFAPGDTGGSLHALHALSDSALRERIGAAARKTALARFSWDRMAGIVAEQLLKVS